jgi:AraC-like DNA-binding protein
MLNRRVRKFMLQDSSKQPVSRMLGTVCQTERWSHFARLKAGPHLLLPNDTNTVRISSSYGLCFHLSQPTRMGQNGRARDVRPGHVHIIPPGNELVFALGGDVVRLFCVFLRPEFVADLVSIQRKSPLGSLPSRLAIEDPALFHLGLALRAAIREQPRKSSLFADSVAEALGARLLEHYGLGIRDPMPKVRPGSKARIQKAVEYIEDRLDENLGMAELAAAAELTQFYFSRLFKQVTGKAPHQYVMERRTGKAVELLRAGNLTISEIAQRTGFSDQSHLGRHIRNSLGVTPKNLLGKSVAGIDELARRHQWLFPFQAIQKE